MGNLYVIRAIDTDHYKIGITSRSVADRLKQLQTGNHTKLEVVRHYEFDNVLKIEQALHAYLATYRGSGEWFDLPSAETVDNALRELNRDARNIIEGHVLRPTKSEIRSDRFDIAMEILSNQNLGTIGKAVMFLWSLFVPMDFSIKSIEEEEKWWTAPEFADDDDDEPYVEYRTVE